MRKPRRVRDRLREATGSPPFQRAARSGWSHPALRGEQTNTRSSVPTIECPLKVLSIAVSVIIVSHNPQCASRRALNRLRLSGIYNGTMAKATWEGAVIAESNLTVEVEGNQYFPPDAIHKEYFKPSNKHSVCPWKGTAKQIKGYIAFWNGVKVEK